MPWMTPARAWRALPLAALLVAACSGSPAPAADPAAATGPAAAPAPAPAAAVPPAPAAGPQWVDHSESGLRVLVFPAVSDTAPLVIALHGRGDKPEAFQRMLAHLSDRVNLHLPAGLLPQGGGHSWFDGRAAADDAELGAGVGAAADRIARYIEAVRRPGQPVVVTGFSQGGMLSFTLAVRHPAQVDLALPLGGFLPASLRPAGGPGPDTPPVRALHGADDTRIPTAWAEETVRRLAAAGFDATLETFPGVGHGVSPPMRATLDAALLAAGKPAEKTPPE